MAAFFCSFSRQKSRGGNGSAKRRNRSRRSPRAARAPQAAMQRYEFHRLMHPVLPTERIAHLSYGRRLLLRDLDPGYDLLGSSTERSAANAKVCFPLTVDLGGG